MQGGCKKNQYAQGIKVYILRILVMLRQAQAQQQAE